MPTLRPDEFDPRATITDAHGRTRPVRAADLHGLDQFIDSWKDNVSDPHRISFAGWQLADDFHPGGEGKPGYRIVWKTIREITFPEVQVSFPDLRVRIGNDEVNRGEPIFSNAIPDREPGVFIVPEWGHFTERNGEWAYEVQQERVVNMNAHEQTLPPANIVEAIFVFPLQSPPTSHAASIAAGRTAIASLRMMLELTFGERVIGPVLTEEVGEVFDDWHWNRQLGGRDVRLESQADLRVHRAEDIGAGLQRIFTAHIGRDESQALRVRVASRWCWEAETQADPIMRFVSYWLAIEALELGENANIAPLKDAVAALLGVTRSDVTTAIGRLYRSRNQLLHGKQRTVEAAEVDAVRTVAHTLLAHHSLGTTTEAQLIALAAVVGVASTGDGSAIA